MSVHNQSFCADLKGIEMVSSMNTMRQIELELQDEGSWALMIEECNALAIKKYHGKMADLTINYYLSIGKERYYKDYLDVSDIAINKENMISFLLDDYKYSVCIQNINNILQQMDKSEYFYSNHNRFDCFKFYCQLLCEYIAFYNSVIADSFYEGIYDLVEKSIPKELKFLSKSIKDALFATNNKALLSHMQNVDLCRLSEMYYSQTLSEEDLLEYLNSYRSVTSSSANPDGISKNELLQLIKAISAEDISKQKAFLNNLHFRYDNAEKWSKKTADSLGLEPDLQVLVRRTSELSYYKILMREEFQKFKMTSRQAFLYSIIEEIDKSVFDYMRIEEINEYLLSGQKVPTTDILRRKQLTVFELKNDELHFLDNIPEYAYIQSIQSQNVLNGDVLIGQGVKRYIVKKVMQDEAGLQDFSNYILNENNKGDVAIVTNVLRPFLVPKLKNFGVLITQYGGFTSHASVLCRELGVNSIISVNALMDSLETGAYIEVDYNTGEIKIVDRIDSAVLLDDTITIPINPKSSKSKQLVGSKAANLIKMCGIVSVPKGFVVTSYALKNLYNVEIQDKIYDEILKLNCELIVIRSSHESEDAEVSSYAGLYESFVNVSVADRDKILKLIQTVSNSGDSVSLDSYATLRHGEMHVVIQEMIQADLTGVLLTSVPNSGFEYMLNEYTVGDLCYLMQGEVTPAASYIRKSDVLNVKQPFTCFPAIIGEEFEEPLYRLACDAIKLEENFGHRLEIEWGIRDKEIFFFQARNY